MTRLCSNRLFSLELQFQTDCYIKANIDTIAQKNQLSNLMVCGLNFTSLFIAVRVRDSPGVQCVPVTLLLRLLAAKMCLQM